MDVSTIIKLLDAGYTKEEIDSMSADLTAPAADPDPAEDPQEDPEEVTDKKDQTAPAQPAAAPAQPAAAPDYIANLQKAISDLTATIRSGNINSDDSSGRQTVQTDEEIIAKLIGG